MPPLFVDAAHVTVMSFFVKYGASAAKRKEGRLRFLFDPNATNTSVLYGAAGNKAIMDVTGMPSEPRWDRAALKFDMPVQTMVERYGPVDKWPDPPP
jgi:hypothetical protein